jgi:hypothetical protein
LRHSSASASVSGSESSRASQVAGGLLMCVPKTMVYGAAMLTCTMIGAVFVDLFVIHMPFFIVPFFLAIVIVIVAMICRESNS